MKIKLKKAVKASPPKNLANQLDEAAMAYEHNSKIEKEAAGKKAKANESIKKLADMFGVKNGKERIVVGRRYEAGFNEVDQPYLDKEVALKILKQGVYQKVKKTITIIDPEIFKQLVDKGEITQDEARQIVKYNDPQRRIVVRPRKGTATP